MSRLIRICVHIFVEETSAEIYQQTRVAWTSSDRALATATLAVPQPFVNHPSVDLLATKTTAMVHSELEGQYGWSASQKATPTRQPSGSRGKGSRAQEPLTARIISADAASSTHPSSRAMSPIPPAVVAFSRACLPKRGRGHQHLPRMVRQGKERTTHSRRASPDAQDLKGKIDGVSPMPSRTMYPREQIQSSPYTFATSNIPVSTNGCLCRCVSSLSVSKYCTNASAIGNGSGSWSVS